MTTNSTWAALRNPAFRKLWIAAVISGTCVAAHDSAATWTMNIFTGSPLLLSLMSTVASLPFFLFTLPAGALADKVDRQKLVCTVNVCLAITTFTLAVLGWLHLIYSILTSCWQTCSSSELGLPLTRWPGLRSCPRSSQKSSYHRQRSLVSGSQFNISGIIGPALGGLLVPLAGASPVFALNARS